MIKDKIQKGSKIIGTHLTMGNYWVADIYGMSGMDFVWIDTEHSPIDYDKLLQCVTVLKAHKTAVFVRTQMDDFNHTKRLLEMGIDGIIFPMIQNAGEAERCLSYTYYPPKGIRGFGPNRAVEYGRIPAADYMKQEHTLCRFVQIETPEAVKNLEHIMQNQDIDGYILGPCDMAISCGTLNDPWNEQSAIVIRTAIEMLKKHEKYVGVSIGTTDMQTQKKWLDLGVDMISAGTDIDFIYSGVTQNARQLAELIRN